VQVKGLTSSREKYSLLFKQYSVQAVVGWYWHCLHVSLDEVNRSQGMTWYVTLFQHYQQMRTAV